MAVDKTGRCAAPACQLSNRGLGILCPNGHLGFAPTKVGSFNLGLELEPDMVACDSGSCDCGPVPLGSNGSASPLAWQRHDIEAMLVGARRLGVPMAIGSARDTGTNKRVDLFIGLVQELAVEHKIPKFKVGYFYSDVDKTVVRRKIEAGSAIEGLDGRPDLTLAELEASNQIVAV